VTYLARCRPKADGPSRRHLNQESVSVSGRTSRDSRHLPAVSESDQDRWEWLEVTKTEDSSGGVEEGCRVEM
jgi:hypothetical protein